MKKHLTFALAILIAGLAVGQNADDAWELSQNLYQGTAKSVAMGGALGAVGGDVTAACINPAGMALYRSTEFTASTGFNDNLSKSQYYGDNTLDNKFSVNIPNIALVIAKERSNYKPLRFSQFGISLTRTNDFNYHTLASGYNPNSSKIDDYIAQIPTDTKPVDWDQFILYPAYITGLLFVNENGEYDSPVPPGKLTQRYERAFKGRSEEWSFAYSQNYANNLYFGVSMGICHIKRIGSRTLDEQPDPLETNTDLRDWSFTEDLNTNGTGFNIKLGAIYAPTYWFRFGASFHSRTQYRLDETWATNTESTFSGNRHLQYSSPVSNYSYSLLTPSKFVGSMAFILSQKGIISVDIEAINYGRTRFEANDYDYTYINNDIRYRYKQTLNLRFGAEWQLRSFYLRGGLAYYGSPFGFGESSGSTKKASCGIGLQTGTYTYFDFAYEYTHSTTYFTLYDRFDIETVQQRNNRNILVATMKFKF